MRDTDGAVISELIGHDRIKATLITNQYKLNHDYRSRLFQLFDLSTDPQERRDVYTTTSYAEVRRAMMRRFRAYDRFRNAHLRHEFAPTKVDPPVESTRAPSAHKTP